MAPFFEKHKIAEIEKTANFNLQLRKISKIESYKNRWTDSTWPIFHDLYSGYADVFFINTERGHYFPTNPEYRIDAFWLIPLLRLTECLQAHFVDYLAMLSISRNHF